MEYTITEVLPGQIVVEFADGSLAAVAIDPTFTVDDIDDAVSYYDPEFAPDPATLINNNVEVGQVRASIRKEPEGVEAPPETETEPESLLDVVYPTEFSTGDILRAQYFASHGDNRMLDALYSAIEETSEIDLSNEEAVQTYLSYFEGIRQSIITQKENQNAAIEESDDIFNLALEELANG